MLGDIRSALKRHENKGIAKIPCRCNPNCTKVFDYERLKVMGKKHKMEFCEIGDKDISINELLDGTNQEKAVSEVNEKTIKKDGGTTVEIKNIIGNVGHLGNNDAQEIHQHQNNYSFDSDALANELDKLLSSMKKSADDNNEEHDDDIKTLKEAKEEAQKGNRDKAVKCLRKVSQYTIKTARGVGLSVLNAIIADKLGY